MRYVSEIFWRLSWSVFKTNPTNSEFPVCLSVCKLASLLTEIMSRKGYLQFWMIYISEMFGHITGIFLDYFKFFLTSCMYVSLYLSPLCFFKFVTSGGQLLRPLVLFTCNLTILTRNLILYNKQHSGYWGYLHWWLLGLEVKSHQVLCNWALNPLGLCSW